LKHIEPAVFKGVSLSIIIPSTILFIASDTAEELSEILVDGNNSRDRG
jgi:hypothetical protein